MPNGIPDIINALFIVGGAFVTLLNVRAILRDRRVAGVNLWVTVWFIAWGIWNLFYYWHLDQPVSWWAEVVIVLANICWLFLAIQYKGRARKGGTQQPSSSGRKTQV